MMKNFNPELEVNVDEVFNDFKKHFNFPGNQKIIFSAKYGMGKSYFLNKFFENEEINGKYFITTLSPVNYSISNNEDIFELIKFDIIRNLFLHKVLSFNNGDIRFGKLKVVIEYVKNIKKYPYQLSKQLITGITKIGENIPMPEYAPVSKVASDTTKLVFEILDDFLKFEKELNEKHQPVENIANKFGDELQNKIGSYIEFNFISALIKEVLEKNKKNTLKSNVLVIEDFDRLDPAHIFRILNIFSAHNHDHGNKFGFDKVVIVCDLSNIESLYKHLYGEQIDFIGYIDKFYSIEPYFFDNKKALFFFLKNRLHLNVPDYAIKSIVTLLLLFNDKEVIRLRKLNKASIMPLVDNKKVIDYEFKNKLDFRIASFPLFIDPKVEKLYINKDDLPIFDVMKYLIGIYGGLVNFEALLDFYSKNGDQRLDIESSENLIKLLAFSNLLNETNENTHLLFFKGNSDYNYPEISFNGQVVRIVTQWNKSTQYKGDSSFYNNSQMIFLGERQLINSNSIIHSLKRILQYSKSNNLL